MQRSSVVRSVALTLFLGACTSAPSAHDAGLADDVGAVSCEADRACPGAAPVWGGACEGTLACPFPSACGPSDPDTYECVSGTWTLTMPAPCAGGSPPLAESCPSPSTAPVPGARLWLSLDAPGAPELVDHDFVEVAFGAQGLAMIPYRVHVDGDGVPACVGVTATLTLDALVGAPATHPVRLRCGDSLRIQDILPELPCEEREYEIGLDVSVEGVGAVSLRVHAMGGGCSFGG